MELRIEDPLLEEHKGYKTAGWEMGYRISLFALFDGDEQVAALKVANITPESWVEHNPTPYHYKMERGWCSHRDIPADTPLNLLQHVWRWITRKPRPDFDSLTDAEAQAHLDTFEKSTLYQNIVKRYEKDKAFFVNHPYIDHCRVREPYRRKGLATALYQYAAHHFAEQGLELRASSLQSCEANALWDSFSKKGWTQEGKRPDGQPCTFLDPSKFDRPQFRAKECSES